MNRAPVAGPCTRRRAEGRSRGRTGDPEAVEAPRDCVGVCRTRASTAREGRLTVGVVVVDLFHSRTNWATHRPRTIRLVTRRPAARLGRGPARAGGAANKRLWCCRRELELAGRDDGTMAQPRALLTAGQREAITLQVPQLSCFVGEAQARPSASVVLPRHLGAAARLDPHSSRSSARVETSAASPRRALRQGSRDSAAMIWGCRRGRASAPTRKRSFLDRDQPTPVAVHGDHARGHPYVALGQHSATALDDRCRRTATIRICSSATKERSLASHRRCR